ncbi:MarR family transcriptional regulator [uncultured Erwinia sp.]|uniref:MarR family winged helix-turn-helix transcriptional regulator n=1 Tax=uncultured Erwinia sp. TaxID=246798 RepID=UPI0025893431|nr:MarR family transcriptional regulator [uncultured Erwinia sp.]
MSSQMPIDKIIAQWQQERPDLDVAPMRVIGQLGRTRYFAGLKIQQLFSQYGLSSSEFDILATLRRSGAPYALNPSQLVSALMINNSTLTSRLDRLEKHGHLIRVPIVGDRRSVHVQLTNSGFQLIDELVGKHVANERAMLTALSDDEQQQLVALLAKLERHLASE